MKITIDFSELDEAVKIMGAEKITFAPPIEDSDPLPDAELGGGYEIDDELGGGYEIPIGEVDKNPGTGPLSIKGHQVLLYIQDHGWRINEVIENPEKGNKYHVSYCQTLERMKNIDKYEKYVATNNTSGNFFITGIDSVTNELKDAVVRLKVCQHCLSKLNYKNYKSNKSSVFSAFSLEEFFTEYQPLFKHQPKRKAGNAKDDNYTKDWQNISKEYRASVGWGCEKCGVILNDHKSLLHTHHKNGVKGDNSATNLAALCILCHSEEPNHGHMAKSVTFEKRNKIIRLRREQK